MEKVKVALVTGGSSGIGAATARMLAGAGIKVYAASRRGTFPEENPMVVPVSLDINDAEATEAVVKDIVAREGRLDAVVCNAGNGIYGPVEGTLEEEARYQFETNFFGNLKTIQAALPRFRMQGHGRIVTITSVMAILQLPYQGFYSAAKAALLSISESLSMELSGSGIQCCSILPGDVRTGFTSARKFNRAAEDPSSAYRKSMERNLGKVEKDEKNGMTPEVIARVVKRELGRRKMHVRVIPRLDYGLVGVIVRLVPEGLKLKIIKALY